MKAMSFASSKFKCATNPRVGAQLGTMSFLTTSARSHACCLASTSGIFRSMASSAAFTRLVSSASSACCALVGDLMNGGELAYFNARPLSGMLLKKAYNS